MQRRWRGGGAGGGREAEFAVDNSVSVGVFMNDLRRCSKPLAGGGGKGRDVKNLSS